MDQIERLTDGPRRGRSVHVDDPGEAEELEEPMVVGERSEASVASTDPPSDAARRVAVRFLLRRANWDPPKGDVIVVRSRGRVWHPDPDVERGPCCDAVVPTRFSKRYYWDHARTIAHLATLADVPVKEVERAVADFRTEAVLSAPDRPSYGYLPVAGLDDDHLVTIAEFSVGPAGMVRPPVGQARRFVPIYPTEQAARAIGAIEFPDQEEMRQWAVVPVRGADPMLVLPCRCRLCRDRDLPIEGHVATYAFRWVELLDYVPATPAALYRWLRGRRRG
jgi:hypothetical protein